MHALIKSLLFLLVITVGAVALLAWLPLVPAPNADQRAAVTLLRGTLQTSERPGNAYAAYWYFYTDVPPAEAPEQLAEAIAEARATPPNDNPDWASMRLPDAVREPLAPEARSVLCADFRQANCLTEFSNRRAAVDELLARHATSLARAQSLMAYSELRDPTPRGVSSPFPPFGDPGVLILAQANIQFLDGQQAQGMQIVCDWAWHWRQLMGNTDMILGQMVGASTLLRSASMFARMAAERAPDVAVPATCAQVFAPLADDEIDQCEEMAGEFANLDQLIYTGESALLPNPASWHERLMLRATFKPDHARGRVAEYLAGFCSAAQRARIAAREPHMPKLEVAPCSAFERTFDHLGCTVSALQPSFEEFYERMIDVDAALRATATALWLGNQPQIDATTLAARPAELNNSNQRLELVDVGRALRVHFASTNKRYGEFLDLPLSLAAPAGSPAATP